MKPDRRPNIFYGYYVVGACFITLFALWGMFINSFGIFFKPMTEDMGWGRGDLAIGLLTRSVGTALAAPFAGRLIDRIGAKPVMVVGASVMGLGLVIGSFITQLWQLYTIFALIGVGLMGATMIPCSQLVSNWFVSRRGTAMALAFVGTSVGGAVMAPFANWIILTYSWRIAFALCGGMILAIVVPVILFVVRNRPSDMGLEPLRDADDEDSENGGSMWGVSVKKALTLPVFWQIAIVMFFIGLVANGIHNHAVPFLIDIGHSPTSAAFSWSLVMIIMIGGKLAFGPIADRWGAKNAMAGAFIMLAVSILLLTLAKPYALAIAFACLYGFACGAPMTIYPLLTANNLGMKNFGAIYGVLVIMGSVGSAVGPVAPGICFDEYNTYLPVFYAFIIFMLLGAICSASIKPAPDRTTDSE